MKRLTRDVLAALAIAAIAAVANTAAQTHGKTDMGWPYATGGVGLGQVAALDAERDKYSLKVVTAARRSGAYLSDVTVRVRNDAGKIVFDRGLDGPYLLIDLPRGRFTVEATFKGEKHEKVTTVHAGDRHEMFFYFDVIAEVLPDPKGAPVSK